MVEFQSTPPVRGATYCSHTAKRRNCVSIHAPREGSDATVIVLMLAHAVFQSTPPVRGATVTGRRKYMLGLFQSTPPVRGATEDIIIHEPKRQFQSTPPVRGAT